MPLWRRMFIPFFFPLRVCIVYNFHWKKKELSSLSVCVLAEPRLGRLSSCWREREKKERALVSGAGQNHLSYQPMCLL